MLEWLMRKIFPGWLKKPLSRKETARQATPLVKAGDGRRIEEPPLGKSVRATFDDQNALATDVGYEPLVADIPSQPGSLDKSDDQYMTNNREISDSGENEKVHIFHFRAWFYADPVKASLTLGLAFLSWLATYTGMLELIQANSGTVDIGSRIAIGFAVMMLMLMILYLLDSLYAGGTPTWIKPLFVFGYLFLTLISVGFGFGFYWKYLEARTEATRSAESAVSQVQVALQIGQSRLEQLQSTFAQLTSLSTQKAIQERDHGNSCPNSKPGEGPRMRLRDSDSQKFGYAAEYITGRAGTVKADFNALNGDLKKVVSRDASTIGKDGTRNKFLRALGRKLDLTIARFNTLRTDPQLRQFRENFDKRASTTRFPNGRGGTFRCPDVQLQTALRGVVRAIDDIPEIKNPKIAAVEGSEAVIEAFRRLAVTLAALPTLKLPPSPDELRKARKQAISAGRKVEVSNVDAGLSKRDYIPLSAAVFVDLCILLISLNRSYDHLQRIQKSVSRARASEFGGTMLDIFEAHKNKISEEMLEIFHNAEFEYGRDYYLAVPLVKGSQKALLSDRLDRNIEEGYRSERDDYDRAIQNLEKEMAGLRSFKIQNEELQARKLTREHADTCRNHNLLLSNSKQLRATYQSDSDEEFSKRRDVIQVVEELEKTATYFKLLQRQEDKLAGPLARIVTIEKEIDELKKKRTINLKLERDEIKGRLSTGYTHDIAKESRFLSNLCISLEANGILHLASIWPLQRVVRAQLKRHDSRYYAQGRQYRVYRFRKVADTQSQMVLDLIMEAVKRSEESGDLNDNVSPPPVQIDIAAADEKARLEEQERKQELLSAKEEIERLQKEKTVTMEAAKRAGSPINKEAADDAEIVTIRELSPAAISRANKGLRSHFEGIAGVEVPGEQLADFIAKSDSDSIGKPVFVEQPLGSGDPVVIDRQKTSGAVKKMFGGFLSFGKKSPADSSLLGSAKSGDLARFRREDEINIASQDLIEDRRNSDGLSADTLDHSEKEIEEDLPVASMDAATEPSIESEELVLHKASLSDPEPEASDMDAKKDEPFVAVKPITEFAESTPSILSRLSAGEKEKPGERQVNEDSLLPSRPEPRIEAQPAPESPEQSDRLSNDPVSARIAELQRGLQEREIGRSDRATAKNAQTVERKPLTDPVILGPGEASQDPGSMLMARMNAKSKGTYDEPSEADDFKEGAMPGFLKGDDFLDEASEEMKAQSLAKRFSPNGDKK
ncbi:MAG: hypothetical protein GY927_24815 [bacterium]|nr:hypothetical protein [bacterium]